MSSVGRSLREDERKHKVLVGGDDEDDGRLPTEHVGSVLVWHDGDVPRADRTKCKKTSTF